MCSVIVSYECQIFYTLLFLIFIFDYAKVYGDAEYLISNRARLKPSGIFRFDPPSYVLYAIWQHCGRNN